MKQNTQNDVNEEERYVPATAKTSCWTRGFIALLITQFTVAMNDNIFRWLIIPIGKYYMPTESGKDFIRTLGGFFLLVPFILFVSAAGFATDRFSRRSVMKWCKLSEIILLSVAVLVICFLSIPGGIKVAVLLALLFLLGSQAAFFSPTKYGVIPDVVPQNQISNANGWIAMTSFLAIVSGQLLGGYLYAWTTNFKENGNGEIIGEPGTANWIITAAVLIGIAVVGFIASLFMPKLKPNDPNVKFPVNMFKESYRDIKLLMSYKTLFGIALTSSFFWGLGALSQNNIDKYACDFLMVKQQYVTILAAILSLGIAAGSLLAGYLSKGRVELGLVPLGALGIGVSVILLFFTPHLPEGTLTGKGEITSSSYIYGSVCLMLLGITAGLYDVPLAAYLQKESPKEKRGRILAAYNFFSFSAMLAFLGLYYVLALVFNSLDATKTAASLYIWLAGGILVLIVCAELARFLMLPILAFLVRTLFRWIYRVEVRGEENVPLEGGVLMIANHVSFIDGLLIYAFSPRPVRFFAHNNYIKGRIANYVANVTGVLRIVPGKKSVVDAIKKGRAALADGEIVGIFPEGGLTRTGQIREFEPGYTSFLKGNENVPIVPVFIGGLFGSATSYADRNRKILSFPKPLRYRVVVEYGKPLPGNIPTHELKHILDEMGADSVMREKGKQFIPPCQALRTLKKNLFSSIVQFIDSTGMKLKPRDFLLRTLIARRILRREILAKDEKNVAILTPPSVGGAIVNAALSFDCRTTINLNYTFTSELLNYCLEQVGIKHVLTSRKVLERLNFSLNAEVVCIEDVVKKVTLADKIIATLQTFLLPAWILEWRFGLNKLKPDDLLTIIYTSGSTGKPKGAMLSHRAISMNIDGFHRIIKFVPTDRLLSVLPFFHAFGFTVEIWVPMIINVGSAYHYTPLEPKKIGEMAAEYQCNLLVVTPTFARTYLRKCPREAFEHVGTVIFGAEKMPKDLADAWEEKYGVRPVEGYGATELSPVVATNISEERVHDDYQPCRREGSIGRPLPFLAAKIVDIETWKELPPDTSGMLVVKSPTVMNGYYREPELTAKAVRNGWYITGDVAKIDKDGFVFITGRESRISKIGGEMVPHIMIEEMLLEILKKHTSRQEQEEETPQIPLVVAAIPDEKKGERIIVLHVGLPVTSDVLCREMLATGCPNIWVPSPLHFYQVEEIPLLATGKLDLGKLREMVKEIAKRET
jgi:acyl-[acyl-carrier-protein]-phospholipid O-acyltransferase/long-chain-fatty-acid--[acyl-carrier-protein] ligase